jgi:hypothetical protein
MEVIEIVSYYLNEDTKILDISFRMLNDEEDTVRNEKINYSIVQDYGYDLISEDFDLFDDEFDDFFEEIDKTELDIDELMIFLNEYYTVNPNMIPESEFY